MYVREAGLSSGPLTGSNVNSSSAKSLRDRWVTNPSDLLDYIGPTGLGQALYDSLTPSEASEPMALPEAEQDLSTGDVITGDYASGTSSAQQQRDDNLGFLNQLIGSLTGENQKILQDLQAAAAKAQYEYSERLSSTAYQRAVKDMRAAGLNPSVLFAGSSGSAASTPQVGIASVATENQLMSGVNSAASILSALANIGKGIGTMISAVAKII